MKNLLVTLSTKQSFNDCKWYYEKLYKDLTNKFNTEHLLICRSENNNSINKQQLNQYDKWWWNYLIEENDDIILNYMIELIKEYKTINVITFNEFDIQFSSKLKQAIWQQVTDDSSLFNSKDKQRELLQQAWDELWIWFLKFDDINEISLEKVESDFQYPFVIKPSRWASSRWVLIVNNRSDFENAISTLNYSLTWLEAAWFDNLKFLIEEYIDWTMYTIDYYVNEEWDFFSFPPVTAYTLSDLYNENDFWVARQTIDKNFDREKPFWKKIKKFIKWNIDACSIRNTFVHHEFKQNTNWSLKTIELNWRIWWFRLMMYLASTEENLLHLLFWETSYSIKNYVTLHQIFPSIDEWIYIWHTEEFKEKVWNTFYYNFREQWLNKKAWITSKWYRELSSIIHSTESRKEMLNLNAYIDNYHIKSEFIQKL